MKLTAIALRLSGESRHIRRLSTAAPLNPAANFTRQNISRQNLYKRLSAVGATGQKISDVLRELLRNGKQFNTSDLIHCVKGFRKYGRYHHCLEIFEWIDKGRFSKSAAHDALRLTIMCKAMGIDEVEKFFDSIPPVSKNEYIYGALLSCYCTEMMTDKALALFKKMDDLNYASNALAFNNLMGLYVKVGEPEKVSSLIEEMKQKNIPLSKFSYYMWIQSFRHLADPEGLERVMHEVQEQDFVKEDWEIYTNLSSVYIRVEQFEKANSALIKAEELLDNPKNAIIYPQAYDLLISMHSNIGNKEAVYQVWHKLKSRFTKVPNLSYLIMLRALSKLDDIEGLKKCLYEWELRQRSYDDRIPTVVIGAYLKHDMLEEAQQLLKAVEEKADQKIKIAHVNFMNYFLDKGQFDSAFKHLEAAMAANWKPLVEKLASFFEHFIEEKDVDSAEELCRKLEKFQLLDSRVCLWLLLTYVAAGKRAPELRERMEKNGVVISTEHEELLQKIS